MQRTRLLLIGATGFVGQEFHRQLAKRRCEVVPVGRSDVDIYDATALATHICDKRIDFAINCAGYTGKPNVDACELDKLNCLQGNSSLPGIIARACAETGTRWGHVSSGCIFTGRRADGAGFTEDDAPNFSFRQNNCSFYSGTKALGEEILADAEDVYIWRLRIPFNNIDSPRNYLTKVMRYETLLEAENSLSHLGDFVTSAIDCFEKELPFGLYNLTNPGAVTTSKVVEMIRDSGVCDKEFCFFEDEDEFMAKAAKTPRSNCVLDSSKAVAAGLPLRPIEIALRESLDTWKTALATTN
ncbi:sugar nucleotide-binding protein [Roseiconus lacunae]|uniref:sugar nucleotide-binding protein n=1 Tax=Roseiconus lacunae TaxID=2605694 RepID=UPI0011F16D83|nr:sugar nucleotide-binding protein [Roseiconus lacunae]